MKKTKKQIISVLVLLFGIVFVVLGNTSILNGIALDFAPSAPTALNLSASTTSPPPGQAVTFTIAPVPLASSGTVTLYAYVDGVAKAQWYLTLTGGAISYSLVPSVIGSSVTWKAIAGNVYSNTVTTTVKTSSTPPTQVTLTATIETGPYAPGDLLFTVSVTPSGSYTGVLTAYSAMPGSGSAVALGVWSLPVNNGLGSIVLNPAGQTWGNKLTYWQVVENGVASNVAATQSNLVVSVVLKEALTIVGILMAAIGAVALGIFTKLKK